MPRLESPNDLRIQVCGPLTIERGSERLEGRLPGRQGRLLATYLIVNRDRAVARGQIAETLWKEPDPAAIDSRLNPLLSKLRGVFGPDSIEGRSSIRLSLGEAWIDLEAAKDAVHRAESAIAQADWARAWGPALTALYVAERGFLPDEDILWADDVRNDLTFMHVRALECYATAGLGVRGTELSGTIRTSRQLIQLAPLRESGYRLLMEALSAQDNIGEALRVYSQLTDRLRDDLGATPSPASRELYERLLRQT